MRTSTPSRAAPISASTSDQLGDEVRVGDPDRALGGDGLDLERARDAQAERLALDDADERRLGGGRIEVRAARDAAREPVRAAALPLLRALPHRVERLLHVARGGPLDAHRGVAPVAAVALRSCPIHSSPMPTPPVMPIARVDDEQLAVVARHEAEPGAEARAG